jgi:pyruvate dehydrogenase E2 component (dihydrolipoamide acetyltransferase)
VDLADLTPTGLGGVVTREDVAAAASPDARAAPAVGTRPAEEAVETVRGVRKATARAMVASAFTAPHVTEWVDVDVSRTRRLVQRLRDDPAFEGVTVSPLLLVAKAVLVGVARHPGVNASWIEGTGGDPSRIVRHRAVNLGIAAATPRGLVVPNIKDAHLLGLADLASRLSALTAAARQGRTTPADLTAGTITVTNVGIFGVDGGTPILNPGEAAILAVGRMVQRPWVHRGRVRPRWVMHLSLSFDHRLVDGDLGSRFLADVAAVLEDPVRALVWS